jgi:hypothetical protein
MDMTRFLKPFLTVTVLRELGGQYEGIIADVTNEPLRNRFKATTSDEAIVTFLDGKRLPLNKGLLRALISWFGVESSDWLGRRIRVFLKPGKKQGSWERAVACDDVHARFSLVKQPKCDQRGATTDTVEPVVAVTADEIPWAH